MNKKKFVIETMTGISVEDWEKNNQKLKEQKELQDFVDGLIGVSWKTLAIASYKLAIKNDASHGEAMKEVYKALLKIANKVLPE